MSWKVVKCTRLSVQSAVKNVKFPLSPTAQDQFTAENVMLKEDRKDQTGHIEDTK